MGQFPRCAKLTSVKIKLIAAIGQNSELGNSGSLPLWRLGSDFERFKKLTTGGVVVMGRKTFESLPEKFRPLPNRKNIVLTRDKSWTAKGAESFESFDLLSPLLAKEGLGEVWIIGGGEIYRQYIDKADELHITHVHGEFVADTFFPEIDANKWEIINEEKILSDEKNSHDTIYKIYAKRA